MLRLAAFVALVAASSALATLSSIGLAAAADPALPAASAPPAPEAKAAEDAARKEEGRIHFERGITLYKEGAWAVALAEFLESRSLYPTRAATKNAALCMRKLQRFDEAFDMFTALLREFPSLPPDDKAAAEREMIDLRALIGAIDIAGAEPGAALVIDGRSRGDYPPLAPIRVPAGTHIVRVHKEGYAPFEARVDVAGGQTAQVAASLQALLRSGRLRVVEQSGKSLDVLVDTIVMGKTPWEGRLDIGAHTVSLRGPGSVGTQPTSTRVVGERVTALTLAAERLDASLRVEPTPAGATLVIDDVNVGSGIWEGRLRPGEHRIEVAAEGFLPALREVSLGRDERQVMPIELQRDPSSALWKKPSRVVFELHEGLALMPSLGGDVTAGCSGGCGGLPALGSFLAAHVGYELPSGVSFGLAGGYLIAWQRTSGRSLVLRPVGLPPRPGTVDDSIVVQGFAIGPSLGLRVGERFPLTLRLSGGPLFGSLRDRRTGSFTTRDDKPFTTGTRSTSTSVTYFHIDPEVRMGLRVGERFEVSAGLATALLVALSEPSWSESIAIDASSDGVGTYAPESLAGKLSVTLVPGLGARYDF